MWKTSHKKTELWVKKKKRWENQKQKSSKINKSCESTSEK